MVTQVFRTLSPPYLWHSFQLAKEVTGRLNDHRLYITSIGTNYGKNSFYYQGAVAWNNLKKGIGLIK